MDLKNTVIKKIQINQLILLTLIMISITGTIALVTQYRAFQEERYSMRELLNITRNENLKLKQELESTKVKLELYNQVLKEKEDLQQELNELKSTLKETQDLLTQAKGDKDILATGAKQFSSELKSLLNQMRLLEGKIGGLDEIKLALQARIQSIKELRGRIRNFKREAFLNKVKVQKEIDRIKLEKGNRGLVIKNGQPTVSTQKTIELEKIIIKAGLAGEKKE